MLCRKLLVVARVDGILICSTVGGDRIAVVGAASQIGAKKGGTRVPDGLPGSCRPEDRQGQQHGAPWARRQLVSGSGVVQVSVTGFAGQDDGLGAAIDLQLAVDAGDVVAHGLGCNDQLRGDLIVAQTLRQQV